MNPMMKKANPQDIAIVEMNLMNFAISIDKGVSKVSAD